MPAVIVTPSLPKNQEKSLNAQDREYGSVQSPALQSVESHGKLKEDKRPNKQGNTHSLSLPHQSVFVTIYR